MKLSTTSRLWLPKWRIRDLPTCLMREDMSSCSRSLPSLGKAEFTERLLRPVMSDRYTPVIVCSFRRFYLLYLNLKLSWFSQPIDQVTRWRVSWSKTKLSSKWFKKWFKVVLYLGVAFFVSQRPFAKVYKFSAHSHFRYCGLEAASFVLWKVALKSTKKCTHTHFLWIGHSTNKFHWSGTHHHVPLLCFFSAGGSAWVVVDQRNISSYVIVESD